jgi:hypothetical protein
MGTRIEAMRRQGVPRHGVAERELAREDTKERLHSRSRIPQEMQRGRANVKGATERVEMRAVSLKFQGRFKV